MDSVIEYVILGVDAVLVPIIYYCYKSASKKLFQIEVNIKENNSRLLNIDLIILFLI